MHKQMERLYEAARTIKKITGQSGLARALNASPQTVKNWESRGISKQGILMAQQVIGCSAVWVETGKGGMQSGSGNTSQALIGTRQIPLLNYVQAGVWTEISNTNVDNTAWLLTDLDLSALAFALEIKGESMTPDFKEGDRVIIDPVIAPNPGDFVVAQSSDNEATFKKYRPRGINEQGHKVIELVPLNPDFPSIRSDTEPFSIIGTMVEYRRYRNK